MHVFNGNKVLFFRVEFIKLLNWEKRESSSPCMLGESAAGCSSRVTEQRCLSLPGLLMEMCRLVVESHRTGLIWLSSLMAVFKLPYWLISFSEFRLTKPHAH